MTTKLYDDKYLEILQTLFEKSKQKSYVLLNPQPNETIADIGCGIGQDAINIAKSGAKVFGIDNDQHFIALANKQQIGNLKLAFICCNANEIPLTDNIIDSIRFDRILQHVADHDKVLKEAARLLKPGGKLIIVDADYLSVSLFLEDEKLERKIIDAIAYNRIPNSHKIRQLPKTLAQNNFSLVSTEIHNYIINDYEFAKSLIRFDKTVDEEFELGNISQTENECWQRYIKRPFNLSINLMLFTAIKKI